jgi:hypothetical protein
MNVMSQQLKSFLSAENQFLIRNIDFVTLLSPPPPTWHRELHCCSLQLRYWLYTIYMAQELGTASGIVRFSEI